MLEMSMNQNSDNLVGRATKPLGSHSLPLPSPSYGIRFNDSPEEIRSEMIFCGLATKYEAFVQEVKISSWFGRFSHIHELYVPALGCSFNEAADFSHPRGNVNKECRGKCVQKVLLTSIQYKTLKSWRDIEFNYRKEVEKVEIRLNYREKLRSIKDSAFESCFGKFEIVENYEPRSWSRSRFPNDELKDVMEKDIREIFYRYAGLRPRHFLMRLFMEKSKELHSRALTVQRNILILYRRKKSAVVASSSLL